MSTSSRTYRAFKRKKGGAVGVGLRELNINWLEGDSDRRDILIFASQAGSISREKKWIYRYSLLEGSTH